MRTTRLNRPSELRTLRVGKLALTYVPDGSVQLKPRRWLPDSTDQDWEKRPEFLDADGCLVAGIGGLLVEYEERALLIDTGFGPHHVPERQSHPALGILEGGKLPDSLERVGCAPERIEAVAFTHLHDDHFGWAFRTGDDGKMFFPNADFLASGKEWQSWHGTGQVRRMVGGRVRAIGDREEIFPGVTAIVTPGHTPGHTSYEISSGGTRVIAFGDVMHSPAQIEHPEWRMGLDSDHGDGLQSRKQLLEELSEPETWGFGIHFADVVFGKTVREENGFRWQPLD